MSKTKPLPECPLYNKRVLELIEEYRGDFGATYEEIYNIIGATRNNHSNYKKGITAFTVPQIVKCAEMMNVSLDWICGLSNSRTPIRDVSPIERIKRAIKELDKSK